MFVPTEDTSPIPTKYLDVVRITETNLEGFAEKRIEDIWTEDKEKELSGQWTGRTLIKIMRPDPPPGKKWVCGQLVRIQKTTRPDSVVPEEWNNHMSWKEKEKTKKDWELNEPRRQAARNRRGITKILKEDVVEFTEILAKAKLD